MKSIIPVERIEKNILMIRGEKVMLDKDLVNLKFHFGISSWGERRNNHDKKLPNMV